MRSYFDKVMASLNEKYGTAFDENTMPREIVRAVTNSHLWIHTRSACQSGQRFVKIIPSQNFTEVMA